MSTRNSTKMPSSPDKPLIRTPLLDRVQPRVPDRGRFAGLLRSTLGLINTSHRILEKHQRFLSYVLTKGTKKRDGYGGVSLEYLIPLLFNPDAFSRKASSSAPVHQDRVLHILKPTVREHQTVNFNPLSHVIINRSLVASGGRTSNYPFSPQTGKDFRIGSSMSGVLQRATMWSIRFEHAIPQATRERTASQPTAQRVRREAPLFSESRFGGVAVPELVRHLWRRHTSIDQHAGDRRGLGAWFSIHRSNIWISDLSHRVSTLSRRVQMIDTGPVERTRPLRSEQGSRRSERVFPLLHQHVERLGDTTRDPKVHTASTHQTVEIARTRSSMPGALLRPTMRSPLLEHTAFQNTRRAMPLPMSPTAGQGDIPGTGFTEPMRSETNLLVKKVGVDSTVHLIHPVSRTAEVPAVKVSSRQQSSDRSRPTGYEEDVSGPSEHWNGPVKFARPQGVADMPSVSSQPIAPQTMNWIAERVYTFLEDKLRTEQERRGIFS